MIVLIMITIQFDRFVIELIVMPQLLYINQMTCNLIIQFDCQIFSHIIHQIFNQTHKNKVFAFVYPAKNISLWYRHERWWQRLTLKELLKHNKQINDGETAGNIRNRVSLVPLVLTVHLVYMWSRDIFTKVSIDIMILLCNCVRQNWRTWKVH